MKTSLIRKWPSELMLIRCRQSERDIAKHVAKCAGNKASYAASVCDQKTPLSGGCALGVADHRPKAVYKAIHVSPYLRRQQTAEVLVQTVYFVPASPEVR